MRRSVDSACSAIAAQTGSQKNVDIGSIEAVAAAAMVLDLSTKPNEKLRRLEVPKPKRLALGHAQRVGRQLGRSRTEIARAAGLGRANL